MQPVISSAKNPTVKHLRKLWASASYRRAQQHTLAHGTHLTQSYLASNHLPVSYIVTESALQNQEIQSLMQQLETLEIPQTILTDSLYESLSDVHARVGISLVIAIPTHNTTQLTGDSILLDDVQDPGNIGTILRTTAAAGIDSVYCSSGCSSVWSPRALRAGMGAQFSTTLYEQCDLEALVSTSQVTTYVTSLATPSVSLYDLDLSTPGAWIFGNEGQGTNPKLQQLATERVTIPQATTTVESLNVAASAAVCLFEQQRQRAKLIESHQNPAIL